MKDEKGSGFTKGFSNKKAERIVVAILGFLIGLGIVFLIK